VNKKLRAIIEKTKKVEWETIVCANRGNSSCAPENTLAAFKSALELKVDAVELDVHLSSDGEIVVIHDENTKRTTGRDSLIAEMTLKQIRQLDAGGWFDPKYKGEKIPTLKEVIQLVRGKAALFIEVKGKKSTRNIFTKNLNFLLNKFNLLDKVVVFSFQKDFVQKLKQVCPQVATTLSTSTEEEFRKALGYDWIDGVLPHYNSITKEIIIQKNRSGKWNLVWTVDDIFVMKCLLNMQAADAIITNRPALLLKCLQR